jgi:hypothetical protein
MPQTTRPTRTDEALLYELITFVRETTHEFFSATSRGDIEEIVQDRFRESDLYAAGQVIDSLPDVALAEHGQKGEAWTTSSKAIRLTDPTIVSDILESKQLAKLADGGDGAWAFVSLEAGRTVYGGLVIHARRPSAFDERELFAIEWFGDTISQAINAVENRRLVFANAVTEIRIDCPDATLQKVAENASCRLNLESFVPTNEGSILVYCDTTSASAGDVVEAAEMLDEIEATRAIGENPTDIVEFVITEGSPLFAFVDGMANLRTVHANEERCIVVAEIASGTCAVPTMDQIYEVCPDATLIAKREHDLPPASVPHQWAPSGDSFEALTDRQCEVLEAAYRGGYFRWPRDSTAEEIAESLSISPPTLHKHLRRAQEQLCEELFE